MLAKSKIIEEQDRIPSLEPRFKEMLFEGLQQEKSRQHFRGIIAEYCDSVQFREKVMKYAGEEIDRRGYGKWKFFGSLFITAIVGAVATLVVERLIK